MSTNPNPAADPATLANELDATGRLKPGRGVAAGRRLHARLHPDPADTNDPPGRSLAAGRDLFNRHHGGTK